MAKPIEETPGLGGGGDAQRAARPLHRQVHARNAGAHQSRAAEDADAVSRRHRNGLRQLQRAGHRLLPERSRVGRDLLDRLSTRAGSTCSSSKGDRLPDPDGLLQGNGNMVRRIVVQHAEDLDRPAVQALLKEAIARADPPLDPDAKRRLVIKSVADQAAPAAAGAHEGRRLQPATRVSVKRREADAADRRRRLEDPTPSRNRHRLLDAGCRMPCYTLAVSLNADPRVRKEVVHARCHGCRAHFACAHPHRPRNPRTQPRPGRRRSRRRAQSWRPDCAA